MDNFGRNYKIRKDQFKGKKTECHQLKLKSIKNKLLKVNK